jgi:hypothetical protein
MGSVMGALWRESYVLTLRLIILRALLVIFEAIFTDGMSGQDCHLSGLSSEWSNVVKGH